ncbi:Yip1 family protein [Rossellomorea sp. BNER]|uniref:Yip1 family protein n=1 Tax=Rossellomorea sp. BNER TaxID=2962031 RepID=UPI003AF218C4|nr:YIP1 family protein [Rossellomorea sp. BNER]
MKTATDVNGHAEKTEKVNPWLSIWVKPRKTIRYVIDHKKFAWVFLLACLAGISNVLDGASTSNIADKVSTSVDGIVLFGLLLGPIFGLFIWAITSLLYWSIGKIFKGTGTLKEVMVATAWGFIPIIVSLLLWIPDLQILGIFNFSTLSPPMTAGESFVIIVSALLEIAISVWYVVVLVKAIAEAHRFSAWKGLGTVIIPGFVVFLFLLLLIFVSL